MMFTYRTVTGLDITPVVTEIPTLAFPSSSLTLKTGRVKLMTAANEE
jgi:hypothetical protein